MFPVQPQLSARPALNYNPGDLRPRHAAVPWPGQTGVSWDFVRGGCYAVFASPIDGWAALALWCLYARYICAWTTAKQIIGTFCPADRAHHRAYVEAAMAAAGKGALDLMHVPTLMALCRAIAIAPPPAKTRWSESDIATGILLGYERWPAFKSAILGGGLGPTTEKRGRKVGVWPAAAVDLVKTWGPPSESPEDPEACRYA